VPREGIENHRENKKKGADLLPGLGKINASVLFARGGGESPATSTWRREAERRGSKRKKRGRKDSALRKESFFTFFLLMGEEKERDQSPVAEILKATWGKTKQGEGKNSYSFRSFREKAFFCDKEEETGLRLDRRMTGENLREESSQKAEKKGLRSF